MSWNRWMPYLVAISMPVALSSTWARAGEPARWRADHVGWVADALERMETVKPGMTRADLRRVFAAEGGLSTGLRRTYVFREWPYFKVDVEFEPVGRPPQDQDGRVTLEESPGDVIKGISRPYLEWSIAD